MPPKLTLSLTISGLGDNISQTREVTDSKGDVVYETIADPAADVEVALVLDVSATKFFVAKSTQDLTIKTNSSGAPAQTLTLAANVPYLFTGAVGEVFFFTTDIAKLFVTNASGAAAVLQIQAITDSTP